MLGFMWWLVIGLAAGGLARLFIPGPQPMGLWPTMGLGLLGSLLGGLMSSVVFGHDVVDPGIHASGLIMSTIGAIIALGGFVAYSRHRA
jgi:uncharacterized membrane protein YeaQ/YmgE (transglycosylase-associated protein family)